MSRYIDADALKKEVDNFPNCYNGWSDTYDKAFIIGAIEEQPSIDIVRCKGCKHWGKWSDGEMFCGHFDGGIGSDADDFCSYGERKEGE